MKYDITTIDDIRYWLFFFVFYDTKLMIMYPNLSKNGLIEFLLDYTTEKLWDFFAY